MPAHYGLIQYHQWIIPTTAETSTTAGTSPALPPLPTAARVSIGAPLRGLSGGQIHHDVLGLEVLMDAAAGVHGLQGVQGLTHHLEERCGRRGTWHLIGRVVEMDLMCEW